ncbi:MAG: hypothetical protein ACRCWR_03785, partial [Saezia sp.]
AKLMVQDDVFFTLGSANLNIRSMAVDSELNLISEDLATAQNFRHTLLDAYVNADANEPFSMDDFPNKEGVVLGQAELKKMHEEFKERIFDNLQRVKDYQLPDAQPINGHAVQFEDTRGVLGVNRVG